MIKRSLSIILVFAIFVYQLAVPLGSALANTGSILPPSNLTFQKTTPDDGKLTWSSVFGATGYNVYEIKEGSLALLGKTTTASYSLNNLAEGKYSYVVSTIAGEDESGPGAPIDVDIAYPDMSAPTSLTHTIQNGSDIVLSWTASQYAESYNLYKISAEGEKTLVTSTSSRTYTVANAAEGSHTYTVSAVNQLYGESPPSTKLDVNVTHPVMAKPANLSFSITNGSDVNLKWQAVNFATSYKIYQVIGGQQELKSTVTSTSAKLTNLPAGDYEYKVYSYSGRFGESLEGTPIALTVSAVTMTPPPSLTFKLQNTNDAVLSWGSVPNATGYKIYQVIDGEKVLKSTVTGTAVTYTNLPAGDYSYEVYSYSDRFGESAEGSKVSFSVEAVTITAPAEVSYKIQNGNDIALTWTAAPNANNYKVYQVINGEKALKSTVTGTAVTFANQPVGDYEYVIHSYSTRFGESAEGSKVSFNVGSVTMTAPAEASYKIQNGNDIVLTWTAAPNANNYKVYQVINGEKVLKSTVAGTTVTYANQPAGDYEYVIHSNSTRFGESQEGKRLSIPVVLPEMQAPINVIQTVKSGTEFSLSWDVAEYATNYKVYQIVNGEKILKSTVSGKTISYSNVLPGEYTYQVHSYSSRFGESQAGTRVDVTLNGQTMEAPTNLTSTIGNGNDISLRWTAVQYASSYKIYRLIDGEKVLTRTVQSTTAALTNMAEGDYDFVIHSVSPFYGESPNGAELKVSLVHPKLGAPANPSFKINNGNDISLTWTAVPYATSYKIYQVINDEKVLKKTVTGVSNVFTNMPEGNYKYEVHAFSDRFGESAEGSKINILLGSTFLQKPENLVQTINNGNDISLKWNPVTYATSYKVYQIIDGEKVLNRTVPGTSTVFTNMPQGDYTFEVHAFSDRFGESAESSSVSLLLVFPIMQAPVNPTHSITGGNDITLRWTASTYATGYNVYQIVDGEKIFKRAVTGTSTAFTNMPEGDYTYAVHSISNRFGKSPESSEVKFNLIWPVVQPPVLEASVFNANNITLSWKAVTWANEYRVYKVTDSNKELIYKGTALNHKVYNLTEDIHSYEVTAYNTRFGESAPSNIVTEDIVYPEMQAPVASLTVLNPTSARISWSFTTYANGYNIYEIVDGQPVLVAKNINNLSYTLQNLTYANHEYYVTSSSNSFGESAPSNVVLAKLIVDTKAPETVANASTKWTNQIQEITLDATDDETGVAKTFYSLNDSPFVEGNTISVEEEGVNKLSFYSVDKVGNTETKKTIEVKIDKTAPVTESNATDTWSNKDVEVALTATDAQSGVAKTYYSIDGSEYQEGTFLMVEKEGASQVSYYSMDEAGNKEAVRTVKFNIDKTAPVTESNVPDTWGNGEVAVTLTATDAGNGVAKTYYSVNGSDYSEGTSFTVEKEGVNEVTYYSIDVAGNKEEVRTAEVKIDMTAPVTESNVPDTWGNSDVAVTLTATDSGSGIAKTYYSINGSEYQEGTSFTVDKEAVNQVSYYSVDEVGNKEEVRIAEVKIDKTAPVTETIIPDTWASKDLVITLITTDAGSGVAKTYYSINGSEYQEGTSLAVDKEGASEITFYSVDAAGNKEEVKTIEVKTDKTAPVTDSNATDTWTKEDVAVTLTATDTHSGVAKTYYSINGSEYQEGTSFIVDAEGINRITYYSVDHAGNKEEIQSAEVKIDKTAPVINMDGKVRYQFWNSLQFTYSLEDQLSGLGDRKMIISSPYATGDPRVVEEGAGLTLSKPGKYNLTIQATDAAGNKAEIQKQFFVLLPVKIEASSQALNGNKALFTVRVGLGLSKWPFGLSFFNWVSGYVEFDLYNPGKTSGQVSYGRDNFSW
ncbi:Ig-like domain repeat protein [Bacillus sp. CECT 9360]|uniref:OmpL47-type beta-barrel domain-containing protein n=1 Tax=Bacillus sp. CECT 9360 TaxID=2845821 RepID=UPI001E393491|nr:Ig-like domain repeat protein [Bacillus sp. CECT 9360]CAH0344840.1 hypothetical protein BCI9360_01109 [Bacillus sp. CECT 9360]